MMLAILNYRYIIGHLLTTVGLLHILHKVTPLYPPPNEDWVENWVLCRHPSVRLAARLTVCLHFRLWRISRKTIGGFLSHCTHLHPLGVVDVPFKDYDL